MIAARESPRVRRLRSDHKAMQQLRAESSILDFETRSALSDPPHEYNIRFLGRGAWRPSQSLDVYFRDSHEVTIRLGANYPRMMPELAWRSPVFHPNISSSGVVCLGGYGTFWAPSLNLDELCIMLWDMVRYANFDVHSPYNREAALWAKTQKQFPFPFDVRPLRDRVNLAERAAAHSNVSRVAHRNPPPPDIQFLGEVVHCEVIDAEIVECDGEGRNSVPGSQSERPAGTEIFIIE